MTLLCRNIQFTPSIDIPDQNLTGSTLSVQSIGRVKSTYKLQHLSKLKDATRKMAQHVKYTSLMMFAQTPNNSLNRRHCGVPPIHSGSNAVTPQCAGELKRLGGNDTARRPIVNEMLTSTFLKAIAFISLIALYAFLHLLFLPFAFSIPLPSEWLSGMDSTTRYMSWIQLMGSLPLFVLSLAAGAAILAAKPRRPLLVALFVSVLSIVIPQLVVLHLASRVTPVNLSIWNAVEIALNLCALPLSTRVIAQIQAFHKRNSAASQVNRAN